MCAGGAWYYTFSFVFNIFLCDEMLSSKNMKNAAKLMGVMWRMVSLKSILASSIKYFIFCSCTSFKSRGSIANFHFWFNKEKRNQSSLNELEDHSDYIGLANA